MLARFYDANHALFHKIRKFISSTKYMQNNIIRLLVESEFD